jgi:hypothetical protein
MAKEKDNPPAQIPASRDLLMVQGWSSIAFWMSVGLLLEGLLGYKIPAYLDDQQRRELFRLAHAHGALLGLALVAASISARSFNKRLPRPASIALSAGSILIPVGFLISGIWHPEGDPGIAIWLVPPGALLMIFGALTLALTFSKSAPPEN